MDINEQIKKEIKKIPKTKNELLFQGIVYIFIAILLFVVPHFLFH